ncbi:bifunctional alpha,alpha-trehalose-phosphate synthase (UDP-forming)/trehalose-phosphatase, partial [Xanthovirga aplysinae]|uniref:bifunctional alpha,alpha-trehalose-phosphate synthase (UDP-forming)/trehalose-phosphatase n=1 Tax=Xanthovirga aplysinae TaxID=2529853 RepID=UPI0012BCCA56
KKNNKLSYSPSDGGLVSGLGSFYKNKDHLWIGWPGMDLVEEKEKIGATSKLEKEGMVPVFLDREEIQEFYEGFSNGTLWPTFHYFSQFATYKERDWQSYLRVNQKFCDEVLKYAQKGDIVWVHDYHLLLLPQLIRKEIPEITIGFFQHIPFPSFEVFRLLPWRKEILNGMLGADLIGFHTYDDMRHFLSSVNRICGKRNSNGRVYIKNRIVLVDSFPMGIDYEKYAETANSPETIGREVRYRIALGNQKLILSMDRLDYSKGIPQRLEAFETFLEKYPEFRGKVSLLMIVVPSRDKVERYKELKEIVDEMVGRINGNFGRMDWTPIHYFYRSFPLHALSAFYRMATVALVTPMRDGMNLISKEFIASKTDKKGVLILSEMAGSAKELSDAILINPNNGRQITEALYQALKMPEEEQILHMKNMQKIVKKYNIHHWVSIFMSSLKQLKAEHQAMATSRLNPTKASPILEAYSQANKRLIFLDYDGTLMPFLDNPAHAKPDEELLALLKKLSIDPKNRLILISGRDKNTLGDWMGNLPLEIVAEHGVWHKNQSSDWNLLSPLENSWKKDFKPVIETYVNRTPRSFIEEKDFSLVWHYRKVDTGLGELRSRELANHLEYLSVGTHLQVLEGDMVIEIKNSAINKGTAAKKWLRGKGYDFILAFGDDWTDEELFKAMPESSFTVKVGRNNSSAQYSLNSPKEVRKVLHSLCNT